MPLIAPPITDEETMNDQTAIIQVPLSKLSLSPRNTRRQRDPEAVEAMAASLQAHRLLQNLTVEPSSAGDGSFEVIAGGTRLAGLQLLAERKQVAPDLLVDCRVVSNGDAVEASAAENLIRTRLSVADEFDAFKAMADANKSRAEVAAHFGVAEIVVSRSLKLANVDPPLLKIFRDGGMKLDQLQALALTDDRKAQNKAWFGVKDDWARRAGEIRKRITQKEIGPENPLVKFVGADTYQAAGGPVRRDMFSDDVYFGDAALLDKLALDKLEATAEVERQAGWSWVDSHLVLDYSEQSKYGHSGNQPKRRSLTDAEQARVDAIDARLKAIRQEMDRDDSDDDEGVLGAEQDALYEKRQQLRDSTEIWPDNVKAKTGVLIYIDQYHGLKIERGRLRPGQRAGKDTNAKKDGDKPKKATLSQDMVNRLEMHRAAAIREHIAADPSQAMLLLIAQLVGDVMTNSVAESALHLRPTNRHDEARSLIDSKFGDVGKSPARKALGARLDGWKKSGLPGKASEIFAWIGKLTEAKRLELLALAIALTYDGYGDRNAAMADQFGVDMTKWWQPTPESFLTLVPKAVLATAVTEVSGKVEGDAILVLKKDGAIAETGKKLAGTGWLPKPLRGSQYKAASASPTKPTNVQPKSTDKKAAPSKFKPMKSAKPAKKPAKALRPGGNRKKPAKKAAKPAPKKAAKK
jgi:ParB family chromosome partitioning protein